MDKNTLTVNLEGSTDGVTWFPMTAGFETITLRAPCLKCNEDGCYVVPCGPGMQRIAFCDCGAESRLLRGTWAKAGA